MGELIKKTRCPKCAKEGRDNHFDNLAVFSDGARCFSCDYFEWEHNTNNHKGGKMKKEIPLYLGGTTRALNKRGLNQDTCQKWGVQVLDNLLLLNYLTAAGSPYGQKVRTTDKKQFTTGSLLGLYGQWLWQPNDRLKLVVTEGELDALAVSQMQHHKWPVVSIPYGSSNAAKSLLEELDYISGFKEVVLLFDNDEAGRKAVAQCVEKLPKHLLRIAKLPEGIKDANDLLLAGKESELQNIIWGAVAPRIKEIVKPADIEDEVMSDVCFGTNTSWPSFNEITYGIRTKEILVIAAANSVGKTQFLLELMYSLIQQDRKVGLFSFEQSPADSLKRMVGFKLNKQIHLPGVEWDKEQGKLILDELDNKLFLYKQQGLSSIDHIDSICTYLKNAEGVDVFIVDNLKGIAQGDNKKLAGIMLQLQSLAFRLDVTFILVSHVSKSSISYSKHLSGKHEGKHELNTEGLDWESGRVPTKENIYGASEVADMADLIFGLARNTVAESETERNVLHVRCLKNRLDGSKTGRKFQLKYTKEGRLVEKINESVINTVAF